MARTRLSSVNRCWRGVGRRGWPGHFFVTTARVGEPAFVDRGQVRELRAAGHVVGSHSHTHPVMTRLSDAELREEWTRSRAILEEILGETVTALSIPTGFTSERVGNYQLHPQLLVLLDQLWVR